MNNREITNAISQIYRMLEASEKGFATAAANISTPGIKILFKYFAQQRSLHRSEILNELNLLGCDLKPRSSIRGMVHRGRVNIFAAMTIEKEGQEKVILQEVSLGEAYARQTYQRILKHDLPVPIREMLNRQLMEISKHSQQVALLRGQDGKKLVIQLLTQESDPRLIMHLVSLPSASPEVIQEVALSDEELYQGQGATVLETILSGAVGGLLWGGLMGALVGFGVVQNTIPAPVGPQAILSIWAEVMLGFMLGGALISSVLGFFIGLGVSEGHTHGLQMKDGRYFIHIHSVKDEASPREV